MENDKNLLPGSIQGMGGFFAGLLAGSVKDTNFYDELINALNLAKSKGLTCIDFILCITNPTFNKSLTEKINEYQPIKKEVLDQLSNMPVEEIRKLLKTSLQHPTNTFEKEISQAIIDKKLI